MYSSGVVTHNKLALYVSDNNKCNLHTSDLPGARCELNFDQVLLLVEDLHHLGVDLVLPLDARPLQSLQFSHHRRRLLNRRDLKHKHDTWRSVFHLEISVSLGDQCFTRTIADSSTVAI